MTAPSLEPTAAMRQKALDVRRRIGTVDAGTGADIIARALAEQDTAARREGFEQARERAARTAEEAPSNINSHWEWDAPTPGEIARAIRALTPEPPSEKENEGG